jgi:hypothetical protein
VLLNARVCHLTYCPWYRVYVRTLHSEHICSVNNKPTQTCFVISLRTFVLDSTIRRIASFFVGIGYLTVKSASTHRLQYTITPIPRLGVVLVLCPVSRTVHVPGTVSQISARLSQQDNRFLLHYTDKTKMVPVVGSCTAQRKLKHPHPHSLFDSTPSNEEPSSTWSCQNWRWQGNVPGQRHLHLR